MKNLKKFLSLLTIGSIACIVLPLVTSCANKDKYEASWDYTQGIFEYTTGRHATAEMNATTALETYFEEAEKNPLMFAEDVTQKMAYYQGRPVIFYEGYNIVPLKAYTVVTDIYFDSGVGYVSFDLSFDGIANTTVESVIFDTYATGKMHFENVGFDRVIERATAGVEYNEWDLIPVMFNSENPEEPHNQVEDWSATLDLSLPAYGYTFNLEFNQDDLITDRAIAATLLNSASPDYLYYLNDVKYSAS